MDRVLLAESVSQSAFPSRAHHDPLDDGGTCRAEAPTYATYKKATSYFLRWLLRARRSGLGLGAVPKHENEHEDEHDHATAPLAEYDRIVAAIAAMPTSLPPALLQRWSRALEACASAITLRARVAVFFGDAADDAHAHFLTRLHRWYQTLNESAAWGITADTAASTDNKPVDLSNYYDVLALPEDYFPDDGPLDETDVAFVATTGPALSKADRKKLQNDAFADDFRTELAWLFMELDELSEAVYTTFLDVKRENKTLVEATVVAKVAIDSAASIIASFQLRHPTLQDGIDLAQLIEDGLSIDQLTRLLASVQTAWTPSEDATEIRNQYVPGTVLVDIVGIVKLLRSIAKGKGTYLKTLGERYEEATTRHFVVPEWSGFPPFFTFQLPMLLNMLHEIRNFQLEMLPNTLFKWLLEPFDSFSKTGAVSIHLVFICICWIRSIAALQANRGLARTVSVSFMHLWDIQERVGASILANNGRGHHAEAM